MAWLWLCASFVPIFVFIFPGNKNPAERDLQGTILCILPQSSRRAIMIYFRMINWCKKSCLWQVCSLVRIDFKMLLKKKKTTTTTHATTKKQLHFTFRLWSIEFNLGLINLSHSGQGGAVFFKACRNPAAETSPAPSETCFWATVQNIFDH